MALAARPELLDLRHRGRRGGEEAGGAFEKEEEEDGRESVDRSVGRFCPLLRDLGAIERVLVRGVS